MAICYKTFAEKAQNVENVPDKLININWSVSETRKGDSTKTVRPKVSNIREIYLQDVNVRAMSVKVACSAHVWIGYAFSRKFHVIFDVHVLKLNSSIV